MKLRMVIGGVAGVLMLATGSQAEEAMGEETLKARLDARRNAFNAKAPESVKQTYEEGVDAVAKSGLLKKAKKVGDTAPDFSLTNAKGETVQLSDYLSKGPVVITWYRGGWCPYCNLTLGALQKHLPDFRKEGATLLALTPELPDKSLSTAEKNELEFEVLSDVNSAVARTYGLVFKLTDEVATMYESKFGLSDYNGNDSNELPLAATYVINSDGKIIYAFVDADYRNRAEPADILKALKNRK